MSSTLRARLLLGSVGLVVAGILLFLVLMSSYDKEWEATKKRLDDVAAETKTPKATRSVLRGDPAPGNAWNEYDAAVKELSGVTIDRNTAGQLLALRGGALEHLALGARRSDGRFSYDWYRPYLRSVPRMAPELSLLASAQAKTWIESGRPQEAMDLLLDMMAFGTDLATNAPLWADQNGMSAYSLALDRLRDLLQSVKLTNVQLETLGKKLETIARDFPTVSSALAGEGRAANASMDIQWPNRPILVIQDVVDPAATKVDGWWDFAKEGSWRYWFSYKAMAVDAFKQREALLQRSQSIDQMNYASARKEAEALKAEAESSNNPLFRRTSPSFLEILVSHRQVLARLNLLRAGVAFLATGDVPAPPDPFGENLLHRQEDGITKIWSLGINGKDDNGQGDWPSASPPLDIVLRISR